MKAIKDFLDAFLTFIHMYRDGFYCSENIHTDSDGTRWGFYRVNEVEHYSLCDIDFEVKPKRKHGFFHIHGDNMRFHW